MSAPIWIVVANGSRARLLQRDRPGQPLFEVMDWVHPSTRQHHAPAAGTHRSSGIGGRSGLLTGPPVKDRERAQFARAIGQWLDEGIGQHRVGAIAVFASNPFLGELMSHGHAAWKQHVCASHPLDLTPLGMTELDDRLRREFRL